MRAFAGALSLSLAQARPERVEIDHPQQRCGFVFREVRRQKCRQQIPAENRECRGSQRELTTFDGYADVRQERLVDEARMHLDHVALTAAPALEGLLRRRLAGS